MILWTCEENVKNCHHEKILCQRPSSSKTESWIPQACYRWFQYGAWFSQEEWVTYQFQYSTLILSESWMAGSPSWSPWGVWEESSVGSNFSSRTRSLPFSCYSRFLAYSHGLLWLESTLRPLLSFLSAGISTDGKAVSSEQFILWLAIKQTSSMLKGEKNSSCYYSRDVIRSVAHAFSSF